MDITDMIAKMGGLKAMAKELGVSEQQAASGAAALAPAILGGFEKQAAPAGAAGGLGALLGQLGGADLLDNVLSPEPTDVSRGNGVLASIFGSKDVSRAVAQDAAAKSGVDPTLLKKMLPIVAMMVAGYMAKQKSASNGEQGMGGGLGGMLGKLSGGLGGLGALGGLLGGAGAARSGGNPLEDILRKMGQK